MKKKKKKNIDRKKSNIDIKFGSMEQNHNKKQKDNL